MNMSGYTALVAVSTILMVAHGELGRAEWPWIGLDSDMDTRNDTLSKNEDIDMAMVHEKNINWYTIYSLIISIIIFLLK